MTLGRAVAGLVILALLGALVWLSSFDRPPPDPALGRKVYDDYCAACHGENLEGQPDWQSRNEFGRLPAPPHDASGHTWHHSDRLLFNIVKHGIAHIAPPGYETDMAGFGEALDDAEIQAVLEYIKSTWPAREREYQRRMTEADPDSRP